MVRKVTIDEFLTRKQIDQVLKLRKAQEIKEKVIEPNLEEINRKLGQENDALYLAYMCEYAANLVQQ